MPLQSLHMLFLLELFLAPLVLPDAPLSPFPHAPLLMAQVMQHTVLLALAVLHLACIRLMSCHALFIWSLHQHADDELVVWCMPASSFELLSRLILSSIPAFVARQFLPKQTTNAGGCRASGMACSIRAPHSGNTVTAALLPPPCSWYLSQRKSQVLVSLSSWLLSLQVRWG